MKKSKKAASKKPVSKSSAKPKSAPKKAASREVSLRALPKNASGITPLGDKVVVRPLSPEEAGLRSASGIIIPETVDREKSEQGVVVAIGPGKFNEAGDMRVPLMVQVDDRVLFSKYGFDEVKVGGVEYYIVGEPSILAILDK
jgi:chaperonin GroES